MVCQHSSRAMRGTRLSALMQHGPWSFMVVLEMALERLGQRQEPQRNIGHWESSACQILSQLATQQV